MKQSDDFSSANKSVQVAAKTMEGGDNDDNGAARMGIDSGRDADGLEDTAAGVRLRAGPRRLYRQALPSLRHGDHRARRLAAWGGRATSAEGANSGICDVRSGTPTQ